MLAQVTQSGVLPAHLVLAIQRHGIATRHLRLRSQASVGDWATSSVRQKSARGSTGVAERRHDRRLGVCGQWAWRRPGWSRRGGEVMEMRRSYETQRLGLNRKFTRGSIFLAFPPRFLSFSPHHTTKSKMMSRPSRQRILTCRAQARQRGCC